MEYSIEYETEQEKLAAYLKFKDELQYESLILAQDERWRRA